MKETDGFSYFVDQFEDIMVLKYRLPGFDSLSLEQKKLIYYLSEAALSGRDIFWAQNFSYNLLIRKTIEGVLNSYKGDRESADYKAFVTYSKRVFFANGIHHHYSSDKFKPAFSKDFFSALVRKSDASHLPLDSAANVEKLLNKLTPVIFNENLYAKKVELKSNVDIVTASAVNMYYGVTRIEVEAFYAAKTDPKDQRPLSIGLNSKLVKKDGKLAEGTFQMH